MAQSEVLAAQLAEYGIKTAPKIDGRLNDHHNPVAVPKIIPDQLSQLPTPNGGKDQEPPESEPIDLDPLSIYLADVRRTGPLLTFDQELALGRQVQAGLAAQSTLSTLFPNEQEDQNRRNLERIAADGKRAKKRLIKKNLRLAFSVAKGYVGRGLALEDLTQEGSIGLMRAADKYDPDKGSRFSTYAYWWIRQGVTRAIVDQARTIRKPPHQFGLRNRISTATAKLEQDFGRQTTVAEIAEETNLSPDKVRQVYSDFQAIASLSSSSPIGHDQDGTLDQIIPDQGRSVIEEAAQRVFAAEVADALDNILPPRERAVIRYLYGMETGYPLTLQAVGDIMGVSRQRIQQLQTAAIRKLERSPRMREMAEVSGIPVNSPN